MKIGKLAIGALVASTLAATACSTKEGGVLLVTVSATPTLIASELKLDVTAGGRMKSWTAMLKNGTLPPAIDYAVELPPDALGQVSVTATAGGQVVMGSATVAAGQTGTLALTFGAVTNNDLPQGDLPTTDGGGAPDLSAAGGDLLPPEGSDLSPAPDLATSVVLTPNPLGLTFPEIATNASSAPATVTIQNSGTASTGSLSVGSNSAQFTIGSDNCTGQVLDPNDNCTFTVTFSPTMEMDYAATISVGGLSLQATGKGVKPGALQSSPPSHPFGDFVLGTTLKKQTFMIQNTGGVNSGTLTVGTPQGPDGAEFKVSSAATCMGMDLAPNATCSIEITYDPGMRGSHGGSVDVTGTTAGKVTISLSGNALDPPRLTLSAPDGTAFGDTIIGSPKALSFIVGNSGDAAMTVAPAVTLSAPTMPVTVVNNTCLAALVGKATCGFDVLYAPSSGSPASLATDVVVTVAGVLDSPRSLALTGQKQTPTDLVITPTSWGSWPNPHQLVNVDSVSKEFTITNNGQQPSGPITLGLGAPNAAAFKFVTSATLDCDGASLGAGQSCHATVVFRPNTTGNKSSSLTAVATNDSITPATLTGEGYTCTDVDGDGAVSDYPAYCPAGPSGATADCDDMNTNIWSGCSSVKCKDNDVDGFLSTGCNRYLTMPPDCDDSDKTVSHRPDILGGAGPDFDADCDGQQLLVENAFGVFVSPTGSDTNPGTKVSPVATPQKAWTLARDAGKRAVFLEIGTYPAVSFAPTDTVSIAFYGGFPAGFVGRSGGSTIQAAAGSTAVWTQGPDPLSTGAAWRQIVGLDAVSVEGAFTGISVVKAKVVGRTVTTLPGATAGSTGVSVADKAEFQCSDCLLKGGTGPNPTGIGVNGGRVVLNSTDVVGAGGTAAQTGTAYGVNVSGNGQLTVQNASSLLGGNATTAIGLNVTGSSGGFIDVTSSSIVGGDGSEYCYGVKVFGLVGPITIKRSTLEGCTTYVALALSYAIFNDTRINPFVVTSSAILGGKGSQTMGMYLQNGVSTDMINNYIHSGSGTDYATGIYVDSSGVDADIVNNYFDLATGTARGITIHTASAPVDLVHNSFFSGGCKLVVGNVCFATLAGACPGPGCGDFVGNIESYCSFTPTHALATSGACNSAGTNPAAYYSTTFVDIDGQARPQNTWEIGPDEVP